jgi:hypothetical protein
MAVIYGSVAGVMSSILMGASGNEKEATAKMGGLRKWVMSKKMPKPMQGGIINYFNELWNQRTGIKTRNMVGLMSPQVCTSNGLRPQAPRFVACGPIVTNRQTLHGRCRPFNTTLSCHGRAD